MGYASGWCTAFFGSKVIAIEPTCVGKGDAHCGWKIQPRAATEPDSPDNLRLFRQAVEKLTGKAAPQY